MSKCCSVHSFWHVYWCTFFYILTPEWYMSFVPFVIWFLVLFFLCYSSRISCLVFCAHSWNWWYSFCESVSSWYKFLPYFFEWCYVFLMHWTYFSILYYLYYHRKLSFFFLFRCAVFYRSFHFTGELVIKRNYILRMMKSVRDRKRCMALIILVCVCIFARTIATVNTVHNSYCCNEFS